jgi:hypothetical protein
MQGYIKHFKVVESEFDRYSDLKCRIDRIAGFDFCRLT